MFNYIRNLYLFVAGIRWLWTRDFDRLGMEAFDEVPGPPYPGKWYVTSERLIIYQPGWGPWRFLPLYLLDYGTRVLTGGAVVSWSRWFYQARHGSRAAAFMTRLLNHIQPRHGANAGPPLWGSKDCDGTTRLVVWAGWLALAAWLVRS